MREKFYKIKFRSHFKIKNIKICLEYKMREKFYKVKFRSHFKRTKADIMIIAKNKISCKCPRLCSMCQVFEKNLCTKFGVSLYLIGSAEHFPIK